MKFFALTLALMSGASLAYADACETRFADLLINGNPDIGPTRMLITQEIVGGSSSVTYHYDNGDGNGMGEAVDPPSNPWTLFYKDKMYMSHDKGNTWNFVTAYDSDKSRADSKAAMTKDATTLRDVICGTDTLENATSDVLEGSYISSVIAGAEIYEKLWVDQDSGMILQSYRHVKSAGFETKTTQVVERYPAFKLPNPE